VAPGCGGFNCAAAIQGRRCADGAFRSRLLPRWRSFSLSTSPGNRRFASPGRVIACRQTSRSARSQNLETESGFSSTLMYSGWTLTRACLSVAESRTDVLNNTGSAIAGCAGGSVCEIKHTARFVPREWELRSLRHAARPSPRLNLLRCFFEHARR